MRSLIRIALAGLMLAAPVAPQNPHEEPDLKLPSGKSQRDEIAKADYEKSLEEIAKLVQLSQEIETELKESGHSVLPSRAIRKLEDIEKLAKRIRNRLNRR